MKQVLAALALCACASVAESDPIPVGRLHHYVRSNQDGSSPEHIYVYLASTTSVEVAKMVDPCTNAAFVTAELDRARNQPRALVGGRLGRDGAQQPVAWLAYDTATRSLHARVPFAGIDFEIRVDGEPWIIYDFDLSELTALGAGRAPAREDFSFAVALIWPEPNAADVFRNLGLAHARFAGAETRLNRPALRFELSGGLNGRLWLDAEQGHVLEARFAEPNHTEYRDFRLVLQAVEDDAADAWAEARQRHWRNCPP